MKRSMNYEPVFNNGLAARCPCGRRIRVAAAVLAAAPITCGACGGDFTAQTHAAALPDA